MRVPTIGRIRPTSSTRARKQWGGFVLVRRNPQLLHARLTGQLSRRTIEQMRAAVGEQASSTTTLFVVLDASSLEHIPLSAARSISELEPQWRAQGVVAVWLGLNGYLANLLMLACGNEQQVPALADWNVVQRVIAEVSDRPAPVARGRLLSSSALVH
jgi:anti-anti-sigma regulatory factor